MRRTRLAVALGSSALLAALFLTGPSGPAGAANQSISFETPSVADPIHTFGEPSIGVEGPGNPLSGDVFVSGPTGTGTQRSVWAGSVDGGHTFRVITPGAPPTAIQSIEDPPGGGDTDLNFDHTGKQYFADLYALACVRVATTSDGGATVLDNFLPVGGGCGTNPGADRQWLAVYDPSPGTPNQSAYVGPKPLVYLEYNNLVGPGPNGGGQWNSSTDGLTYTDATNGDQAGATLVTTATEATYSPFGPDGYPAIDQVTGKVFQPAGLPEQFPNNGSTSCPCDLVLNIGTPDAKGNLTFLDAPALPGGGPNYAKLIHVANGLTGSPDTLFTVASMDAARNLYVAWAISPSNGTPAQRQVFVSAASAATNWTNWTPPVQVSDGSTKTGDAVNVFPWIKAGGAGRADAVWYGSNKNVDPSTDSGQAWNVFMAQVVYPTDQAGAITGGRPSVSLVRVTPHPMHYDGICLLGTACITKQGNRNLADFFEVNIDNAGAAEIVYDDTSNGLIQPGFTPDNQQLVDHAGAPLVTVARQSSGMGLYGTVVSGPSNAPVSGITDPSGDAKYPVIGGANVQGMDIVASSLNMSADGQSLNVVMKVVDVSNPAATAAAIAGTVDLQYVTRWQMGNTIYYAAMTNTAANMPSFYAGAAQSVDLCSVSACFPHVLTYNEPNAPPPTVSGSPETGTVVCPATPSATNPCSLSVNVKVADVGSPNSSSLLEEVGAYAFAAAHPQNVTTNAQALADDVPLEIDGACCYNFEAAVANGGPPPCHDADANGDIHGKGDGDERFTVEAHHCKDGSPESVQTSDPGARMNFSSTQILAKVFDLGANAVTMIGTGTDNGSPVTFSVHMVDGGTPSMDTFSITLSDGYANSGTLIDGTILVQ